MLLAFSFNVVANDTIKFTWKGGINKQFTGGAASIGDWFTIKWGDATPDEIIIGPGSGYPQTIFHSYSNTNYYTVTIIGNSINSLFGISSFALTFNIFL